MSSFWDELDYQLRQIRWSDETAAHFIRVMIVAVPQERLLELTRAIVEKAVKP
jgi:hypothetical protein